jgi:hypothetical protein
MGCDAPDDIAALIGQHKTSRARLRFGRCN